MSAREEFEANLVGRYGGQALDPVSHRLTLADLDAIEDEARCAERQRLREAVEALRERVYDNHDEAEACGDCRATYAYDDVLHLLGAALPTQEQEAKP